MQLDDEVLCYCTNCGRHTTHIPLFVLGKLACTNCWQAGASAQVLLSQINLARRKEEKRP